jgi:hypothetical protein
MTRSIGESAAKKEKAPGAEFPRAFSLRTKLPGNRQIMAASYEDINKIGTD